MEGQAGDPNSCSFSPDSSRSFLPRGCFRSWGWRCGGCTDAAGGVWVHISELRVTPGQHGRTLGSLRAEWVMGAAPRRGAEVLQAQNFLQGSAGSPPRVKTLGPAGARGNGVLEPARDVRALRHRALEAAGGHHRHVLALGVTRTASWWRFTTSQPPRTASVSAGLPGEGKERRGRRGLGCAVPNGGSLRAAAGAWERAPRCCFLLLVLVIRGWDPTAGENSTANTGPGGLQARVTLLSSEANPS